MRREIADGEVSVHVLAKEIGRTSRMVQMLCKAGMPRAGHGLYDLAACRAWLKEHGGAHFNGVRRVVEAARKNRAVVQEFRRILGPLPSVLAPRLLGKTQREISEILRNVLCEAVSEFSYQKLGK